MPPTSRMEAIAAQGENNERQITELRKDFNTFAADVRTSIDRVVEKVNRSGSPNWQAMGFAVSVIVVIGGLVAFGIQSEYASLKEAQLSSVTEQRQSGIALDNKLQREQQLINTDVTTKIQAVNDSSKERHAMAQREMDVAQERIRSLESWNREQISEDLKELRQRRMRDCPARTETP